MLTAGFSLQDDAAPRTEYWERFTKALTQGAFFADTAPDILIPHEDTAIETNWPRYGNPASAYVRGAPHDLSKGGPFQTYVARILAEAKRNPAQSYLYVNMHPFFRAPLLFRHLSNLIVADVSLAMIERDANPNTISMPALPIVSSRAASPGLRPIMASFQGVNSHPVRDLMKQIADDTTIVVNFVSRDRFVGKVDAVNADTDHEYEGLLANSNFAFVPRGDALFSYRLAEVMSFGCIPIILSDGWVLPFDRILAWEHLGLRVHADAISHLPQILAGFTSDDIVSRQRRVLAAYEQYFANLDATTSGLMAEADILAQRARTNGDPDKTSVSQPGAETETMSQMAEFASRPDNLYDDEVWDALMQYYAGMRRQ
jgi:Exostosin family